MMKTSWVHEKWAVWVYDGCCCVRSLSVLEGPFVRRDEALSACRHLRREEQGRRAPRRLVVLPTRWEVTG